MKKYGTIVENQMQYAPLAMIVNGAMVVNPKAEHFAIVNAEREKQELPPYLEVIDIPPQTDVMHYAIPTGWMQDRETWKRTYEMREVPPKPPRAFDRFKIVIALKAKNAWKDVRNALLAEDDDALDMLFTADDITEDEPLLASMVAMLKDSPFNWTDAEIEDILNASIK